MATNKVVKAMGQKFGFKIVNGASTAIVIALLAAFFDTAKVTAAGTPLAYTVAQNNTAALVAAGYPVGAVLDDGTVATSVVCSASNTKFSIRQFREYIKHQGLTLKSMTIQATNEDVFNNNIEVTYHTPLSGNSPNYINLSEFKSVDQQSDTKIVIPDLDMPLDVETVMLMTIPGERTVSILLNFE